MQDLKSVELLEYFEQDVRPTFIVDLTAPGALKTPSLRPAFNNAALRSFKSLQDAILGRGEGETAKYAEFKVWVLGGSLFGSVHPQCLLYGGFQWTRSIVRKRWSIVSGSDFSCAAEYRRNSARESSKADGNHSQKADDLHDSVRNTASPFIYLAFMCGTFRLHLASSWCSWASDRQARTTPRCSNRWAFIRYILINS